MAEIRKPKLSITPPENGFVTVTVQYDAAFSALEHFLAQHGLIYRETIRLFGEDAGLRGPDDDLHIILANQNVPLPPGEGPVVVHRVASQRVSRDALQEDGSIIFIIAARVGNGGCQPSEKRTFTCRARHQLDALLPAGPAVPALPQPHAASGQSRMALESRSHIYSL